MPQLEIEKVTKQFGDQKVLKSFDLEVAKGEFVALLGPSGCGKSTLLRIIAGLEQLDGGRVVIAGRDVSQLPPERRNVALMFQSYALLPHMTVFENVRFPLRMRSKESREQQAERVRQALDLVQLAEYGERKPRQLSGGQQQRVALARSIVAEPDVLLLDEPLSNLDARLRDDMQVELKRLHAQLGLTTIFVTHDQEEALALADNVVLMNKGIIEQQGSPEQVYGRPRTVFSADFIGGANILTIDVTGQSGKWQGALADGTVIELADEPGLSTGTRRFMLRKEAVQLKPAPGMVAIDGEIETRNYLGSHVRSVISAGGQRIIAVNSPAELDGNHADVKIGWHPSDLMLLED